MEPKVCLATKKRIDNDAGAVIFPCPKCGEFEIVRSSFARKNAIAYTCPQCGFKGPN
jgi:Zn-ribbon RNA-binding protein